ncbi:hypothetical protein [Chroococcidiopsis sp. SAG 2025]|uniref:hypothetical protein n=1 Tax=Chroococcidiopsis sp. SAG 2025 TaxID=171389 RepID=UPI002936E680|nr:hypothetical protein [Chroococcidiopsis sp. SAG 2025]
MLRFKAVYHRSTGLLGFICPEGDVVEETYDKRRLPALQGFCAPLAVNNHQTRTCSQRAGDWLTPGVG